MAWQQRMETIKATRVDRTAVVGLIAGIILGLTLGLLIGWVWWPVEWRGSEPAAAPAAAAGSTAVDQFNTPEGALPVPGRNGGCLCVGCGCRRSQRRFARRPASRRFGRRHPRGVRFRYCLLRRPTWGFGAGKQLDHPGSHRGYPPWHKYFWSRHGRPQMPAAKPPPPRLRPLQQRLRPAPPRAAAATRCSGC